ncbi:major tail protein [Turicibacter sanguinis]|uniref:major tail protein n=1 Tax=Turicibacter sanguinis TaxID=154288 RepID=UPI0029421EDB|nr:major tail protein [Turicibacter sanguinis]
MAKKLLKGLRNIHFAPYVNGQFQTPEPILYAKKIENQLNYESETEWADDAIVDQSNGYNGGEGALNVLGLLPAEQKLLFGNEVVKGGVVVKTTDEAPVGAFLFERGKKGSTHKRLYVVYACKCAPSSFNGETVEEGKASASENEISYTISNLPTGEIYHYIDTDDESVDQTSISKWFTQVQMPKPLEE